MPLTVRDFLLTRTADSPPFFVVGGGDWSDLIRYRRRLLMGRKTRRFMIKHVEELIEELESLKKVNQYKYHIADDFKSFDVAIDHAIEVVRSYIDLE